MLPNQDAGTQFSVNQSWSSHCHFCLESVGSHSTNKGYLSSGSIDMHLLFSVVFICIVTCETWHLNYVDEFLYYAHCAVQRQKAGSAYITRHFGFAEQHCISITTQPHKAKQLPYFVLAQQNRSYSFKSLFYHFQYVFTFSIVWFVGRLVGWLVG